VASGSSSARAIRLDALRRVAAQDIAVERIEGQRVLVVDRAWADLRKHAALGGFGIDVGEMRKAGPIIQIAEGGHAVPLGGVTGLRPGIPSERARNECASADAKKLPARKTAHERDPTLAALAASHHQMVGNADAPYFGSSGGRPKRSQRAVRCLP
jgi:hypothetical protein